MQGHQPLDQAAQSHIQPGLECLQGWGIHSLLGQPVPMRVKNFLLISNLNLPCLSLKPFPLVLSLSTLINSYLKFENCRTQNSHSSGAHVCYCSPTKQTVAVQLVKIRLTVRFSLSWALWLHSNFIPMCPNCQL